MAISANVLYGPESLAYETSAAVAPTPGFGRPGKLPIGTQLILQDGRKFRFAEAGAVALVQGNVIQALAPLSTDIGMTPAAGVVGDRLITFTHGAAVVAANFFSEGYAVISQTPGGGDSYKLANHLALQNAVAGDVVNLAAGQALRRALSVSSRVDLMAHPYSKTIQAPITTLTGAVVGVAVTAPTANQFCFLQTTGLWGVLPAGPLVGGSTAVAPGGAGGAPGPSASATSGIIGTVINVSATTLWSTIFLHIDA